MQLGYSGYYSQGTGAVVTVESQLSEHHMHGTGTSLDWLSIFYAWRYSRSAHLKSHYVGVWITEVLG